MTGFEARLEKATEFEDRVVALLRACPWVIDVAKNGTEHTHPAFTEQLRQNPTWSAKLIRYAPDGVLLHKTERVYYFEAKRGDSLEKDAYEVYTAHQGRDIGVLIFFEIDGKVYYQHLQKIRFRDSAAVVEQFPPLRRFPVIDGWICPRAKPGFRSLGAMSGTPYRYVDVRSLKPWRTALED